MSTAVETLPPFWLLMREFGFQAAYKKWQEHHRADERVLVGPWDDRVFFHVHEEVRRRCEAQGISYAGCPNNSAYEVTPTGGRLIVCDYIDPILGPPAPLDPPADELLRLFWIAAYWEQREEDAARQFGKLKTQLRMAAANKRRDPQKLEELKSLQRLVKRMKSEVDAVNKQLEPLLPLALREPSPEQLANDQAWSQRDADFDRELDRIEL